MRLLGFSREKTYTRRFSSVSDMWFPYDNAVGRGNEILDSEHNGVCVAKQIEEGYFWNFHR